MLPIPILLRLARRLETLWASKPEPPTRPERAWASLRTQLTEAEALRWRIEQATARRWDCAAASLKQDLNAVLKLMGRRIEELREQCETPSFRTPDRCEWIRELRHLESEFGTVTVRWTDSVIRIVTEPIELKGVSLGPFAIEFHWTGGPSATGSRAIEVKALKPNRPAGRSDVTHPHVEDDILCAGEAKEALDQAIADGRLVDAFQLVHSVLTNYNPHSAYVSLHEWDGSHCAQCGRRIRSEEASSCEGCDCDLCDECGERCEGCDELRCGDCLEPCDVCRERHCRGSLDTTARGRAVCSNCREACSECQASFPKDELDSDRHCPTCSTVEETDDPAPETEAAEAIPL
ncbi:MAG: hypothetical protein U0791_24130 [Gemmataceae bacterium]